MYCGIQIINTINILRNTACSSCVMTLWIVQRGTDLFILMSICVASSTCDLDLRVILLCNVLQFNDEGYSLDDVLEYLSMDDLLHMNLR